MTSFALKLLAYITMIVDHSALLFFSNNIIMRSLGRISFPIFAFLLAQGYIHTKNKTAYFFRLVVFAIISQPLVASLYSRFDVVTPVPVQLNILCTLSVGLLLLHFFVQKQYWKLLLLLSIFLYIEHFVIKFEYGLYGIAYIFASYLFSVGKKRFAVLSFLALSIGASIKVDITNPSIQILALLALIPLFFYNNKQGTRTPRLLFYWLYPIHLILLIIVHTYFY